MLLSSAVMLAGMAGGPAHGGDDPLLPVAAAIGEVAGADDPETALPTIETKTEALTEPPFDGAVSPSAVPKSAVPKSAVPKSAVPPVPPVAPPVAPPLVPPTPAVPPLAAPAPNAAAQQALADQFASLGREPLRETFSNIPNLEGDGCAPLGSLGQLTVGRICITVDNVFPGKGTTFESTGSALLEGVNPSAANFNSAAGIAPNFGSGFVLAAQNLGSVPGTGPTMLTGSGAPSAPYAPSQSTVTIAAPQSPAPSAFLLAADNAFRTNPNLKTPGYPVSSTETVFDKANSGVVAAPGDTGPSQAFLYYDYVLNSPLLLPGYAVGFVKLTENMSPLPRDRVYMNYSYFSDANFFPTRGDVNRFMPGFEKTFFDGWTSIEVRTPFAATLSNKQQYFPGSGGANVSEYRDIQFGNMSMIFKTMLVESKTWAITTGVQVMLPTAANTQVSGPTMFTNQPQTLQSVYVANESVHVMPFVGSVWAPNDRFFNQALLQVDRDVNGNPAYVNDTQNPALSGRQLNYAGRLFYPTFMFMSFGTGYWLYKDDTQTFTGFSPVLEIHVNQALNEFCPVQHNGWQLGPSPGVISLTNALIGCNFEWGTRSTLSFGYVTPLGGGLDRYFDGEFRAMYNWRFGRQNDLRRAQF